MTRVSAVKYEKLTSEQQRIYKEIAGSRMIFGGPYTVWIRHPELADAMNKVGDVLRVSGKMDKRLMELMILVVAREWNCDYQWLVHEAAAIKAGLSPEVVDAIRKGEPPQMVHEDEQLVYAVVIELIRNKCLSQSTYDRVLTVFGDDLLLELVTNCGRYIQSAIVVNCYEVPTPGDKHPMSETK